jgi:hypothetical protein
VGTIHKPGVEMSDTEIEVTLKLPISEYSSLKDKIGLVKHVCKTHDANASFEHDGIEIFLGPNFDVGEALSRYYQQKENQSKREADKLKVYIAALVGYIGNTNGECSPNLEEAKINALKIYYPSLQVDLVREAIKKLAEGEFNP